MKVHNTHRSLTVLPVCILYVYLSSMPRAFGSLLKHMSLTVSPASKLENSLKISETSGFLSSRPTT